MSTKNDSFMVRTLATMFSWVTNRQEETPTCAATESLYADMAQIEESLSRMSTKPIRVMRDSSKPVASISEKQKLIDLAG